MWRLLVLSLQSSCSFWRQTFHRHTHQKEFITFLVRLALWLQPGRFESILMPLAFPAFPCLFLCSHCEVGICEECLHNCRLEPLVWVQPDFHFKEINYFPLQTASGPETAEWTLSAHPRAFLTFGWQGCLSPLCWHRAVKSCLHGKLRSWKTDKPASKKTTKSRIKNLLLEDGVSARRETLIHI